MVKIIQGAIQEITTSVEVNGSGRNQRQWSWKQTGDVGAACEEKFRFSGCIIYRKKTNAATDAYNKGQKHRSQPNDEEP
jgi:hypothetical protein